jgi:glycosyltransferase involved in cell wall biosynthesis
MRLEPNKMPELTVAMPAYNTGKYIGHAIESVLAQEGIDFELIVVDDGSTDNTVDVVNSFDDSRITLLKNSKNMGYPYCHNLIIRHSRSPFVAQVDSDDAVLPGAFHKLVTRLKNSPNVGQVHCYYFNINENGKFIGFPRRWFLQRLLNQENPAIDYKRELVFSGSVNNGLRTFRKDVFDVVGTFNEEMKRGIDHEMALRLVDKFDIELEPEFLYARRIRNDSLSHQGRSQYFMWFTFWLLRYIRCHRLLRSNQVQFLKQKEYNLHKLMLTRLFCRLKLRAKRKLRLLNER